MELNVFLKSSFTDSSVMPLWERKVKKGRRGCKWNDSTAMKTLTVSGLIYSWTHTPRLLQVFDFQRSKVLQICPYTACWIRQTPECVPREEDITGDSFMFDKPKPVLNYSYQSNSTRNVSCPYYYLYCRYVCPECNSFLVFSRDSKGRQFFL